MSVNFDKSNLDWNKNNGLIPAIVQDSKTLQVLMLGYMNEEALDNTIQTKKVTFFSRSRNKLWVKGETSGNFLELEGLKKDCDNDTILVLATPLGPTCHLGRQSCFEDYNVSNINWLLSLEEIIKERYENENESSYTRKLFKDGIKRIAQKVGEEATETVIAAVGEDDNFKDEVCDLLFHLLVLLKAKDLKLEEVMENLKARHNA